MHYELFLLISKYKKIVTLKEAISVCCKRESKAMFDITMVKLLGPVS